MFGSWPVTTDEAARPGLGTDWTVAEGLVRTFLGEDWAGWRIAIICAVLAAIAWEIFTALTRRISMRLPFLVLYLARIGLSRTDWEGIRAEVGAELHVMLTEPGFGTVRRFINGMVFALPLAFGGVRRTASVLHQPRRQIRDGLTKKVVTGSVSVLAGAGAAAGTTALLSTQIGAVQAIYVQTIFVSVTATISAGVSVYRRKRRE
jgi:hypothetical protein